MANEPECRGCVNESAPDCRPSHGNCSSYKRLEETPKLKPPSFETDLDAVLKDLRDLLIRKNKAYGNSAFEPVRVFSQTDATEQLRVRIDDKLSRIARGEEKGKVPEDTEHDLLGYLVLLEIAKRRKL